MSVLFLTDDLMFSSRVASAAQVAGVPLVVAPSVDALLERSPATGVLLILIDLSVPACQLDQILSVVSQLRAHAPGARLIAFGPHVWEDKLAAAREAGCDEVLARGQFNQQMSLILESVAGSG